MKNIKFLILTIGMCFLWSCISEKKQALPTIKHVVVIGFDGLSPDGLENANTPTFDKLIVEGSSTMHARAVLPTSSSPNWASMIMGAGPEQHGITSNAWEKNNFVLPAITQSEDFLFPTIFNLVNSQIENAEIGAIYHWDGFGRLFEKSTVDYDINPATADETAKIASAYIQEKNPKFTFIHFDHIDHAGHEFGHGTPEYYKSVEKADVLLAEVMKAITSSEMASETVVIISADHGGLGKGHGGESLGEVEIPFIVWGKSVKKNHTLKFPVYQYDNAATVAFALGIKTPMAWIGKPVKNAFEGFDETDAYLTTRLFKEPQILPKAQLSKKAGGLFNEEAKVIIENLNNEGEIRYTLTGEMPSRDSEVYSSPFKVSKNTVVKSAIFKNERIMSTVNEAFFRIKSVNKIAPITYEVFYLDNLTSIPSLEHRKPDAIGTCFEITSDEVKETLKSNMVVRFKTTINLKNTNEYAFFTRSDDGSKLWIDGNEVVDNDGDHGVTEKGNVLMLDKGKHTLEVVWFNGGGGGWLDVFYQSKSIPKQIIPTTILE